MLFLDQNKACSGQEHEDAGMNRTIYSQAAEEMWPVVAVVLYDELQASDAAKALLDHVAADAGGEIQFSPVLWRIDGLSSPATSVGILRDLQRSRVVVLALCAGRELPKPIFDWVESWAHSRSGPDSALVVLGSVGPASLEKLAEIAKRQGITLFSEQTTPSDSWCHKRIDSLETREQIPAAILEEIPGDSRNGNYRDWGINE